MTETSLALQTAIRSRLITHAALTTLVPVEHIFDRNKRPEAWPCIIIGDGQTVFADDYDDFYDRAYSDLQVWTQGPGLESAKAITGKVRAALPIGAWEVAGFKVPHVKITNARFFRDPSNEFSRAVLTVEAIMQRGAA